jgi:hypothetical protein
MILKVVYEIDIKVEKLTEEDIKLVTKILPQPTELNVRVSEFVNVKGVTRIFGMRDSKND